MSEDNKWWDDPDELPWSAMGSPVEIETNDGEVLNGTLAAMDYYQSGDDEVPVWSVEVGDRIIPLTVVCRLRRLSPPQ